MMLMYQLAMIVSSVWYLLISVIDGKGMEFEVVCGYFAPIINVQRRFDVVFDRATIYTTIPPGSMIFVQPIFKKPAD
jgi:hypothetical protein